MAEKFLLRAVPDLVPAGPHKGYLAYVTFFATNGVETLRWFSTNSGRYVSDFADFVGWRSAEEIVEKLSRGENATFPGTWSIDTLANAKFLGVSTFFTPSSMSLCKTETTLETQVDRFPAAACTVAATPPTTDN
jgi:hypothetical protein